MTKKIVLSAIAASVMASSAMATYGSTMLSYGAKDKAMGGTGIASANGAQSGIMNPAMIAGSEEEISANATFMMIDVTAKNVAQTETASQTDSSIVPTIAYAKPINKDLTVGLNVYGGAGMGVDYTGVANLNQLVTNLQILKVSVPVAYKTGALTVGIAPVMAQGELNININAGAVDNTASDTAFSYEIGAAYEVNKELNVGLVYRAPISLTYDQVIQQAGAAFSLPVTHDNLEQPSEMGLGVTYKMGDSTINLDYRTLAWSDANGYGDFGWEDQNIIGLGYEYNGGSWTARAGYSSSSTPLTVNAFSDNLNNLNAIGFPATIDTHITFGGSYDVSKKVTVDAAVVLASGEDFKSTTASATVATNAQTNVTIGANYKF